MAYIIVPVTLVLLIFLWRLLAAYVRHDVFAPRTTSLPPGVEDPSGARLVQFPTLDARLSRGAGQR